MSHICEVRGCKNKRATAGKQKNGNTIYRKVCTKHHYERQEELAEREGYANALERKYAKEEELAEKEGYASALQRKYAKEEELAEREGFDTVNDYRNSKHEYRWAVKPYCENVDGRLGFRCTTTIMLTGQLEVDHIYPKNRAKFNGCSKEEYNSPENLHTLCSCCHKYKTIIYKDYANILDSQTEALLDKLVKFVANKY
jgi:5-methylcytosine-specific restriction endonuclease McrA